MSERWKVYQVRVDDPFWNGCWIAQPPGASFEDSYSFGEGLRAFDCALNFATQQAAAE